MADPVDDLPAYRLASLIRARAMKIGRDPLVLLCQALLRWDPNGLNRWIAEQRDEARDRAKAPN